MGDFDSWSDAQARRRRSAGGTPRIVRAEKRVVRIGCLAALFYLAWCALIAVGVFAGVVLLVRAAF